MREGSDVGRLSIRPGASCRIFSIGGISSFSITSEVMIPKIAARVISERERRDPSRVFDRNQPVRKRTAKLPCASQQARVRMGAVSWAALSCVNNWKSAGATAKAKKTDGPIAIVSARR